MTKKKLAISKRWSGTTIGHSYCQLREDVPGDTGARTDSIAGTYETYAPSPHLKMATTMMIAPIV